MKYDKTKAIDIIVKAANNYKLYLQDKVFLIIYKENAVTKTVQVEFRDSHFLHLTGVQTKLSAKRFYEKCIKQRLSVEDFELEKGGKTQQKLTVLPFLHELLYNNCVIGNFIKKEVLDMATSSIKKNFVISGEEQVEKFANAIEESYQESLHRVSTPDLNITHLRGSSEVKKFMARRKNANG